MKTRKPRRTENTGPGSLDSLVSRLEAHIAQMAPHQRARRAGKLLVEAHRALSETCAWKQNEYHGYWEGTCGLAWEFTSGTPESNGLWCCPRCGRRVDTANVITQTD
jgi:hypothetical protein